MERDIPFFERPRVEGRLVHASFGWGGAGDDRHGGALLVVANPDGGTFTVLHRFFAPGEEVRDDWPDLTAEQARIVARSIGRSQRKAANFAVAREEDAARRLLEDLERDAFAVARAEGRRLTRSGGGDKPSGSVADGLPGRRPASWERGARE